MRGTNKPTDPRENVNYRCFLRPRTKPPTPRPPMSKVTDQQVQALLTRYACPTPLHVLRMRFLGAIASPQLDVSPIRVVEQAWGGELPEFATQEDAEELIQALVAGLWNRLSQHQNSRNPFRLPRTEVKPTRQALMALAQMRSQELAGFVDGLFGPEEEMDLPEKAHEAMNVLADVQSMFAGALPLLADESQPATQRPHRHAAELPEDHDCRRRVHQPSHPILQASAGPSHRQHDRRPIPAVHR
jgi:hypothetical protein